MKQTIADRLREEDRKEGVKLGAEKGVGGFATQLPFLISWAE